jgi:hypothetical protein
MFELGRLRPGDKARCDRVRAGGKDDGYGPGRCLRRHRWGGAFGYDHRYAAANEIGCERWQPIELVLRVPILIPCGPGAAIRCRRQSPPRPDNPDATRRTRRADQESGNPCYIKIIFPSLLQPRSRYHSIRLAERRSQGAVPHAPVCVTARKRGAESALCLDQIIQMQLDERAARIKKVEIPVLSK